MVVVSKAILHDRLTPDSDLELANHRANQYARATKTHHQRNTRHPPEPKLSDTALNHNKTIGDNPSETRNPNEPLSAIAMYIDRFRRAPPSSPTERRRSTSSSQPFWWISPKSGIAKADADQGLPPTLDMNIGAQRSDSDSCFGEDKILQNEEDKENVLGVDCLQAEGGCLPHCVAQNEMLCEHIDSDLKKAGGATLQPAQESFTVDNLSFAIPDKESISHPEQVEKGQSLSEIFSSIISKAPKNENKERSTSPDRFSVKDFHMTEDTGGCKIISPTPKCDSKVENNYPTLANRTGSSSDSVYSGDVPKDFNQGASSNRTNLLSGLHERFISQFPSANSRWATDKLTEFARLLGNDEVEDDDIEDLLEKWRLERGLSNLQGSMLTLVDNKQLSYASDLFKMPGTSTIIRRNPSIIANEPISASLHCSSVPAVEPISASLHNSETSDESFHQLRFSDREIQTELESLCVSKIQTLMLDAECQTDNRTLLEAEVNTDAIDIVEDGPNDAVFKNSPGDICQTIDLLLSSPDKLLELSSSMFNIHQQCNDADESEETHHSEGFEDCSVFEASLNPKSNAEDHLWSVESDQFNNSCALNPKQKHESHSSTVDGKQDYESINSEILMEDQKTLDVPLETICKAYTKEEFEGILEKYGVNQYTGDVILRNLLRTVDILQSKIKKCQGKP